MLCIFLNALWPLLCVLYLKCFVHHSSLVLCDVLDYSKAFTPSSILSYPPSFNSTRTPEFAPWGMFQAMLWKTKKKKMADLVNLTWCNFIVSIPKCKKIDENYIQNLQKRRSWVLQQLIHKNAKHPRVQATHETPTSTTILRESLSHSQDDRFYTLSPSPWQITWITKHAKLPHIVVSLASPFSLVELLEGRWLDANGVTAAVSVVFVCA